MQQYDIIIVGAGAAGVFASYELTKQSNTASVLMLEKGLPLEKRICPIKSRISGSCVKCEPCNIMNGYGGAGALSDGKYNITTKFGGDLHTYIGVNRAMSLMEYVDSVLCSLGGAAAKLYSTSTGNLKTKALCHNLHLMDAKVRHLGTDRNVEILRQIYDFTKDRVPTRFGVSVMDVKRLENGDFHIITDNGEDYQCHDLILTGGRSGSRWISEICDNFGIETQSNRVDIGVRVELPAEVFKEITDEVYESKIVYKTDKYNDMVRTFCMNPYGEVVA
ncbi:MAG: FAD-dependent oxidoreductase, partial [Clostridia bacterium]|nr:FAD-dependent oxidoreductase [Clostridia bacterium]